MHLNLVENVEDEHDDLEDDHDNHAESARARELKALASIVEFAIYTAESTGSHEALAYLQNVAEIVKADLADA